MKRIIAWSFVLLWVIIIFRFSSDSGEVSLGKSQVIVERVEQAIETGLPVKPERLHLFIRKAAHVLSYFVLTLVLIIAFKTSKKKYPKLLLNAWIVATLIAATDELYQRTIPGRSGELRDVLIDSIGIISALLGAYLVEKSNKRRRNK